MIMEANYYVSFSPPLSSFLSGTKISPLRLAINSLKIISVGTSVSFIVKYLMYVIEPSYYSVNLAEVSTSRRTGLRHLFGILRK